MVVWKRVLKGPKGYQQKYSKKMEINKLKRTRLVRLSCLLFFFPNRWFKDRISGAKSSLEPLEEAPNKGLVSTNYRESAIIGDVIIFLTF